MKIFLVLCLFAAGAYFGYQKYASEAGSADASHYDLAKVEEHPIPRDVLFQLWKALALQRCVNAEKDHNLTSQQCRALVEERHPDCARSAAKDAPALIAEKSLSKQLGRRYLDCATPYFFCKGVEVRSEEEARRHCQ